MSKPTGKKNYGSIPHLSSSKLGSGDRFMTEGQERILTIKKRDRHDVIRVFEKYDGSNVGIVKHEGKIYPLTRSGYLASTSPYKQHHLFSDWVKKEDIDLDFFYGFTSKLYSDGMNVNYTQTIIGTIKTVMNDAVDRELTTTNKYLNKRFAVKGHDVESIYLNLEELKKIYSLDLKGGHILVRDLFVVGCFTGLRFSDWHKVTKERVSENDGVKTISIMTKKTTERVVIPLHPYVNELIEKYNGELPKLYSNQKTNQYLKLIGEKAGLNETVYFSSSKGGKMIQEPFLKYQKLSTHTARRSFATNAFKAGIPSISIMKITGHKTEKNFMKYIKISLEENAELMSQHSFFKGTD